MAWDAPRYFIAFAVHMGCYVLLLMTLVFLRWWYKRENSRKEKKIQEGMATVDTELKHSFEDLTDRENVNFRYVY